MVERTAGQGSLRDLIVLHAKHTLLGLVVILVPVVVVGKSIQYAYGALNKALAVAPQLKVLGDVGLTVSILLLIVVVCWSLGWFVKRTTWGQRLLHFEKSKFFARSPFMKEQLKAAGEGSAAPARESQPALAHVASGWQPGVIVEERADGWVTVFLPDVPSVDTGRLYCLGKDQILRLDLSLDAYRVALTSSGHGSQDWLAALSTRQSDAASESPPERRSSS